MNTIEISTTELVLKLQENRKHHQEQYLKAVEGYKKEVVRELEQKIAAVKAGEEIDVYIKESRPTNHDKDYSLALEMLSFHNGPTIALDKKSFRAYVQDDWDWKERFTASNSKYLGE